MREWELCGRASGFRLLPAVLRRSRWSYWCNYHHRGYYRAGDGYLPVVRPSICNWQRLTPKWLIGARLEKSLGRVLSVYEENKEVDLETLELKMGEAILSETPDINKYISFIQVISVSAACRSIGNRDGMIETFQAITLFGTGDPKTMAGVYRPL